MLDPEYLLHISEGAEEIAEQLHQDIINRIINSILRRIGRGDDYIFTAKDKWQLEVLEEAGIRALSYDNAIYEAAGLSPLPLIQSPYLMRLMQRTYEATIGEWRNFTRTTANEAQRTFLRAVDKAYTLTVSGTMSYTQAVKEAINDIARDGVEVVYLSGHRDTIETATLRAVRTGISQACGQITDARLEEMDWDIILVSAHLGARVTDKEDYTNHAWWQGKFYSRTGRDNRFPLFSVCGMGDVQGIHGANCQHSHGPGDGEHNPFEQYDSEENRKAYELQNRQRVLERRIRKTKREAMTLKEAVDKASDEKLKFELNQEYQRKAALLQKQNKAYREFCEQNGLKPLQDRIQIAKWDRKQAAAARGAAKRYENKSQQKSTMLGSGMGSKDGAESVKKFVGTIDYVRAKEAIPYFNNQIRNEPVENAVVIERNGHVSHFIGGKSNVDVFDVELEGAYIIHNHPESQGIVSFGRDDFDYIKNNPQIAGLYCCNKEYDYSLTVLKPLDEVVYNKLYLEAMTRAKAGEDIQDVTMRILDERGYIKYEKRRSSS
ncbi:MAG: hypothetical protein J1E64_14980 [Acetatifactor sp.]|nr:hypothetical protein [Acetatifactor sp.]